MCIPEKVVPEASATIGANVASVVELARRDQQLVQHVAYRIANSSWKFASPYAMQNFVPACAFAWLRNPDNFVTRQDYSS